MFDDSYKSEERNYTLSVTLVALAVILSPAVLFFLRPLTPLSTIAAAVFSLLCLALAWTVIKGRPSRRVHVLERRKNG